jgi:hypothetical protein
MGSSGKKKTTMAKLARENRLRERRLIKQAKKDARRQESADRVNVEDSPPELEPQLTADPERTGGETVGRTGDPAGVVRQRDPEPTDPRSKEAALTRLRDASDEELSVFEGNLRDDAVGAGATEQEIRRAQRAHPEHGA